MPIFDYRCPSCGHRFEALLLSRTQHAPACPACGAADVEKQPSVFGVGSGSGPGAGALPRAVG
ncbi:MAG: zinc ribbon domain-containing protein [Acidobacteria bacterium]|nr:zinc ribbon domain-containing protein [Acidobacteriota bacterium]